MNRRVFLLTSGLVSAAILIPEVRGSDSSDPWQKTELMKSSELAKRLKGQGIKPHVYCVGFPVLYRQRHILGATIAGPASKPEGVAALRTAMAASPKDSGVVLYCGCCPMKNCPNIRPAYRTLKALGFDNLGILDLPTNFHTDWAAKGYPVSKPLVVGNTKRLYQAVRLG